MSKTFRAAFGAEINSGTTIAVTETGHTFLDNMLIPFVGRLKESDSRSQTGYTEKDRLYKIQKSQLVTAIVNSILTDPNETIVLPSGNRWTNRNLGALSTTSEGFKFSWGNTTSGSTFNESTYANTDGSSLIFDIPTQYDAARVMLGDHWRIPSKADFDELIAEATLSYSSNILTATYGGKSIKFYCPSQNLSLWTRSISTADANKAFRFQYSSGTKTTNEIERWNGLPIRPIWVP